MLDEHTRERIHLFREELLLCGVGDGERVVVLTEGDQLRNYAESFVAAARELGADVEDLNLHSATAMSAEERITQLGVSALTGDRAAMSTLKDAGLVVDLMLLLFSKEQVEIQAAGARMLLVVEPFEVLKRLFPSPELRERVEAAERRLASASELRFTNEAGTDVRYAIDGRPVLAEYGYTDRPGRWDHWPSGFLATLANEGGVSGRVVMAEGDILLPQMKALDAPIEFQIEQGRVTEIRGKSDAEALRQFIEGYDDPRAYAVSHIGWGLNELADWSVDVPGIGMDSRAHCGNVLFSLGPDIEFGGANDTPCHLDLPMRRCTLFLDDEIIVEKGEIVVPELRAPGR
jgi:2,5-dihydroxypyridine 5,6-dioxygenase